jgi:hypothetical protein
MFASSSKRACSSTRTATSLPRSAVFGAKKIDGGDAQQLLRRAEQLLGHHVGDDDEEE